MSEGRVDRLNGIEVKVGAPSPQWTTIMLENRTTQMGLDEEALADLHFLLTRALEHVRKVNRQMGRDV